MKKMTLIMNNTKAIYYNRKLLQKAHFPLKLF